METISNSVNQDQYSGQTKELIYMNHILGTLTRAQSCFDAVDKDSVSRFALYMTYLSNICLDDETQALIDKEVAKEEVKLKKIYGPDPSSSEIQLRLGMVVCKYVMRYLNSVMELNHVNISGAVGLDDIAITEYDGTDLFED